MNKYSFFNFDIQMWLTIMIPQLGSYHNSATVVIFNTCSGSTSPKSLIFVGDSLKFSRIFFQP